MSEGEGVAADRRVALITGASRGIGEETAVALARAGFDVALAARGVASDAASYLTGQTLVIDGGPTNAAM